MTELLTRVQAAAANSPYVVTPTASGFDVVLSIVDAQWWSVFERHGLSKSFTHHVKLDPARRAYSITDEQFDIEWSAGAGGGLVPRLKAQAEWQQGRIATASVGAVAAPTGSTAGGAEYDFSSETGRKLIVGPAKELDWKSSKYGADTIIAVVAASLGILLALAIGVLAIVLK